MWDFYYSCNMSAWGSANVGKLDVNSSLDQNSNGAIKDWIYKYTVILFFPTDFEYWNVSE